jgi:hypothetical protein
MLTGSWQNGLGHRSRDLANLPVREGNCRNNILVRVGMVRLEKDIPINIPHLSSDYLRPVYTIISGDHLMTAVGNHLTIGRTSRRPHEMKDCVLIRRIHQVREDAEDTDKEL